VASWMPRRAKAYVIRVIYRRGRGHYYVKLVDKHGRRRVVKGLRGAERFERERDGLWVVITNRWQGNPVVLPIDDAE
jgi:hypothetical protein